MLLFAGVDVSDAGEEDGELGAKRILHHILSSIVEWKKLNQESFPGDAKQEGERSTRARPALV